MGDPYRSGTEAAIGALSRDDLAAWVKAHLRPDNATLMIVGDTTLAETQPKLEAVLASWKAPAGAAAAVMGTIGEIVRYGRPDDWSAQRAKKIAGLTPATVNAATAALKPDSMTWIVVGDLSKIEAGIRALELGDVKVLDSDGKVVR